LKAADNFKLKEMADKVRPSGGDALRVVIKRKKDK